MVLENKNMVNDYKNQIFSGNPKDNILTLRLPGFTKFALNNSREANMFLAK